MIDPLAQTRLQSVMDISSGDPGITIGLIDGPIDYNHPAFQGCRIKAVKESQLASCKNASSAACRHGTFVAGMLCAKRGFFAPAICPGCLLLLRPIFSDQTLTNGVNKEGILPTSTPEELSRAIIEVVDAKANIINLSLGLCSSSLMNHPELQEAIDYARRHGTIIVASSGNQGNIGGISLIQNEWTIPVAACDKYGRLGRMSNFGPSIGTRGLMAPGTNIRSIKSGGGHIHMSGTSFAAPFVTGTIALLWSLFPNASVTAVIHSITAVDGIYHRRSIIPSLINAERALKRLSGDISI